MHLCKWINTSKRRAWLVTKWPPAEDKTGRQNPIIHKCGTIWENAATAHCASFYIFYRRFRPSLPPSASLCWLRSRTKKRKHASAKTVDGQSGWKARKRFARSGRPRNWALRAPQPTPGPKPGCGCRQVVGGCKWCLSGFKEKWALFFFSCFHWGGWRSKAAWQYWQGRLNCFLSTHTKVSSFWSTKEHQSGGVFPNMSNCLCIWHMGCSNLCLFVLS